MTEEEAYLAIAKKLLLISDKLDTLELCMHDVQQGIYLPSGDKDAEKTDIPEVEVKAPEPEVVVKAEEKVEEPEVVVAPVVVEEPKEPEPEAEVKVEVKEEAEA